MQVIDIRKHYLDYFTEKGHVVVPSALLVPENDPTTLFTGSGMQPIVTFLLGQEHPLGKKIANSQKCFRSQDIEEVGDNRHTTFFEMLGNWSFGDYFKKEQIPWVWHFLTRDIGLKPDNLYFTCFRGNANLGIPKDTEAAELWQKLFFSAGIETKAIDFPERDGMQGSHIFYYDEKKNWWSRAGVPQNMPVGEPGGPDSEIFWDFGADLKIHETSLSKNELCHVNCDCGRFIEIGNNVFMEYKKTANGFEKLAQKNVDFGGGLERLIAAKQNDPDVFMGYIFDGLRQRIEGLCGKKYGQDIHDTFAFRVVMDHLRASVFLIADGVRPSNSEQGYILRRLLRRAIRHADILKVTPYGFSSCVASIASEYRTVYPDLTHKSADIISVIDVEEKKFRQTLTRGMKELERRMVADRLTGKDAFELFSTYGFPLELTQEIAKEKGIEINQVDFRNEFRQHQELSRTASVGKFKGGLENKSEKTTMLHTATHLMLAGLRQYLGTDIHQAGSNITEARTRFDFTYPKKVSRDILAKVEKYVNEAMTRNCPIVVEVMDKNRAKITGVEGSFWEKYPDKVTVYSVKCDDGTIYSQELCGGPHVSNTGDIKGVFRIMKEEASSAGVRRIRAVVE